MSMVWNNVTKMANGLVLGLAALGLTATAAVADEVVLYSSNQPELLDVIAQGFKEKTGHTMTSVRMGTGEAMKRIAAERANPLCDVFWSGDLAVLDNAKADFASYKSPEAACLDAALVEKDAKWTASNTHLMIFMVNTDLIPEAEMPKSWADLLDPRFKGKIVIGIPEVTRQSDSKPHAWSHCSLFVSKDLNAVKVYSLCDSCILESLSFCSALPMRLETRLPPEITLSPPSYKRLLPFNVLLKNLP